MGFPARVTLEAVGSSQVFQQDEIAVGREKDNDYVVEVMSVSRRHCRLRVEGASIQCLDLSRSGVFERLGTVERPIPPGVWTPVATDGTGRAVLILGDVPLNLTVAAPASPAAEPPTPAPPASTRPGPVPPPFDSPAAPADAPFSTLPIQDVAPAPAPPPRAPARSGPTHAVLSALLRDGTVRLDAEDPGLHRLLDLALVFARFVLDAQTRLDATRDESGVANPLADLGEHADPAALVRAFVTGKTGRRALSSALGAYARFDAALLAGFERGVQDLLAALDPASGTHGGHGGLLGLLDTSLQNYTVFFHQLADTEWREVVFGSGFMDGFEGTLHSGPEGED
jgi:hypothetical protein